MQTRFLLLLFILNFLIASCDSGLGGNSKENLPPSTFLTVKEINLPEGEYLVSQVNISWWGDDPDGYITGYEFYIGDAAAASDADWEFTTRTDSTFILPIPEGNMFAEVQFTVRAIDNEGLKDENPPTLTFPIKNTPPEVSFNTFETPPDTTYRIVSFGFTPSDPDGEANLRSMEFALNDTSSADSWKDIPLNTRLLTFRIDDTQAQPTAETFTGRAMLPMGITLDNVNVDGENEFFVRSIDNAGAISHVISHKWYVKKQTSNVLFLNDAFSNTEALAAIHSDLLNKVGITEFDYMDISDGFALGGNRVPLTSAFPDRTLGQPTINKMLAEWDHIYWISNDLDRNIGYALELTLDFFEQGGTMFVNIPTTKVLDSQNSLLNFLPFERIEPTPGNYISLYLTRGSRLTATPAVADAPVLVVRRNITNQYPIIPFGEAIPLFEAPFLKRPFSGPNEPLDEDKSKVVSAASPGKNLVYFGFDLRDFTPQSPYAGGSANPLCNTPENPEEFKDNNDNPLMLCSDLEGLMEFLLIETLGFEQ